MKKIILLTGDEIRHRFFYKTLLNSSNLVLIASFFEDNSKSLKNSLCLDVNASKLLIKHINDREISEREILGSFSTIDEFDGKCHFIKKGEINEKSIVSRIINLNPDLIICYGSSLIKGDLLTAFKGRFVNIHLGLSPYYRGSGTNIWPLINNEPEYIGTTFMHINEGIDTGNIIHQIRAKICMNDTPHSIGNRLIIETAETCKMIINRFDNLLEIEQPICYENKYYKTKDFNNDAVERLYRNLDDGLLNHYVNKVKSGFEFFKILENPGFKI